LIGAWFADVPVEIGRDDARRAAQAELSDPVYAAAQPNWFDRAVGWVAQRIADLVEAASGVVPGGGTGLLVLLLVVLLVVVVVRLRVGPLARTARRRRDAVFTGRARTADEHRAAAERALAAGDFGAAVRERFRAVVRTLEERGVLDERAGRTADEAAREAGARIPVAREELRRGAELFDAVHYGGRAATADDHRLLAGLDDSVTTARPGVTV